MPKKLQRKLPAPKSALPAPAAARAGRAGLLTRRGRVGARALAEFTNQLAVLLNAGIPITRSLRILEGQLPQGPMKRICAALVEDASRAARRCPRRCTSTRPRSTRSTRTWCAPARPAACRRRS
jgi:type II secretory pathway component PulF